MIALIACVAQISFMVLTVTLFFRVSKLCRILIAVLIKYDFVEEKIKQYIETIKTLEGMDVVFGDVTGEPWTTTGHGAGCDKGDI